MFLDIVSQQQCNQSAYRFRNCVSPHDAGGSSICYSFSFISQLCLKVLVKGKICDIYSWIPLLSSLLWQNPWNRQWFFTISLQTQVLVFKIQSWIILLSSTIFLTLAKIIISHLDLGFWCRLLTNFLWSRWIYQNQSLEDTPLFKERELVSR